MPEEKTIDTTEIHEILKSHLTKEERSEGVQVSQVAKRALGIEDPRTIEIQSRLKDAILSQIPKSESDPSESQLSKNSMTNMFYKLEDDLKKELENESPEVYKSVARFVNGLLIDITCDPKGAW